LTAAEAAALAAELDDDGSGTPEVDEVCEYLVAVRTGDAKGASTDATVTFSAAGQKADGTSTVIRERALDNAPDNFSRGNTDVFKLTAGDLGALTHARIGHDDAGDSPGWLLQSVSVTNVTKGWEKTLFPSNVWLDKARGGETHFTLYPSKEESETHEASLLVAKKYVVSVTTADRKGAGTDARVWIECFGASGKSSGERTLENASNNFERGRTDRFELEMTGMGAGVRRVRVGHDDTGFGSSWCLVDVRVQEVETGTEITFDVPRSGIWLEDGSLTGTSVDLVPLGPNGKPPVKTVTYKVEVHTADVKFAGTDANVFVELLGANGTSGLRRLSSSRENFERGKTDVFFMETPNLGELSAVKIGHDNAGTAPGWCLDRVIVSNEDAPGETTVFDAGLKGKLGGRWLDKSADGGVTQCTLAPLAANAGVYYGIETMTSDVTCAGTDANVSVALIGLKDGKTTRSRAVKLENSLNTFERGALEEFEIGPVPDVGDLVAIEIGHDGTSVGSGWRCDRVAVWNLATPEQRFHFPIDAWFNKNEPPRVVSVAALDPEAERAAYLIDASTSDVKDAGTNANVTVCIFGDRGDSGFLKLNTSPDTFQRASEASFTIVDAKNVGAVTHVVVGHDESGVSGDPSWHVAQLKIHNLNTGEVNTFPAHCWIGKNREPHFASQIALAPAGKDSIKVCWYRIAVRTSDVRFAGTDAKVFCKLIGAGGKTTALRRLENDSKNFERNTEDVFMMHDVDVGEVREVEISHDGSGVGSDWSLFSVEVTNTGDSEKNAKSVFFFHDDWVKKSAPVVLHAANSGAEALRARYRITTHTSDVRLAGTDATVTARLFGEANGEPIETAIVPLENSANNFERGRVDEFVVELKNVGVIKGIEIFVDTTGIGAAWHLKMVSVAAVSDLESEIYFHHDDWLDGKKPSVKLSVEDPSPKATCRYVVETLTSDLKGAGTDARVSLVLFGEKGETDALLLENAAENFQRGKKDVFHVEGFNVGTIARVRLGHDNRGSFFGDAAWHCASLEITNAETSEKRSFVVNRWFAENKPPNLISQVLFPGDAGEEDGVLARYVVVAHTSDLRGAGTDANVTLELVGVDARGKRRVMGPFPLETSADDFKRGAVATFRAEGPGMVQLTEATVAHDGAGVSGGSGWHLKMIEVSTDRIGSDALPKTVFWCDALVEKDVPRTLKPSADDGGVRPGNLRRRYVVTVRTSSDRGAGTDANVWIEVFGEKGSTGRRALETSEDDFKRGASDVFAFESPFLGEIQSIKIGHDNSGFGPAWKLQEVSVEDATAEQDAPASHRSRRFVADAWLDSTKPPFSTRLGLTPSDGAFRYRVDLTTGTRVGAGTDREVAVSIHCEGEDTPWTPALVRDDHNFDRGATDTFIFSRTDEILKITGVALTCADGGVSGDSWICEKVAVRSLAEDTEWVFHCGEWVSEKGTFLTASVLASVSVTNESETAEAAAGAAGGSAAAAKAEAEAAAVLEIPAEYRITFYTGGELGAGADATVFIELVNGSTGARSGALMMDRAASRFDAARVDACTRVAPKHLGELTDVFVWIEPRGESGFASAESGGAWNLDRVVVQHVATERTWEAAIGAWISPGREKGLKGALVPEKRGLGFAELKKKAEDVAEGSAPFETSRRRRTGADVITGEDEKAPSPRKDFVPVPVPVPVSAPVSAPVPVPVSAPVSAPSTFSAAQPIEVAETPEERETREFAELEARAEAEAEAERSRNRNPSHSTRETMRQGGSAVHALEIRVLRNPPSVPLRVRVFGKGGEAVADVPPNVVSASFSFPKPLDSVTKAYVSLIPESTDASGENSAHEPVLVVLERVSVSDPARGETCAFQLRGCALDRSRAEARCRREALPETPCEEWEEAVARKDGREKKYWFSQTRNQSVWKEPSTYYPVRFARPENV
jgi:hypothetical protein